MAPYQGFYIADFPLWKLHCLLDENYLEEDVLNAISELLYFRRAVVSTEPHPTFLFMPTSFLNNARRLYQHYPQQFNSNIQAIRDRLSLTQVDELGFTICDPNHYTAGFHDRLGQELEYGDSMGQIPPSDIYSVFSWIFTGLNVPVPSVMLKGTTALQTSNQGCGSCGVASINFIEFRVDPTAPRWSSDVSDAFRNKHLRDLVVYYCIALGQGVRSCF